MRLGIADGRLVTVGSSMGATGALVIGLRLGAAGIVAISPHIDLDVAATECGRWEEVACIAPDADPDRDDQRPAHPPCAGTCVRGRCGRSTRALRAVGCADDTGVYRGRSCRSPDRCLAREDRWCCRDGRRRMDPGARPGAPNVSERPRSERRVLRPSTAGIDRSSGPWPDRAVTADRLLEWHDGGPRAPQAESMASPTLPSGPAPHQKCQRPRISAPGPAFAIWKEA